jgi:hypothetical protein
MMVFDTVVPKRWLVDGTGINITPKLKNSKQRFRVSITSFFTSLVVSR